MHRLNRQDFNEKDFETLVKRYCSNSNGITKTGLIEILRDHFLKENEMTIREFLKNLGYDKNLYPYLNRFYSINFFTNCEVSIQAKFNIFINFDQILCNLILEGESVNEKARSTEANIITFKSQ
jgi:hypothetical protein